MIVDTGSSNISYVVDVDSKARVWEVNKTVTSVFNPNLMMNAGGFINNRGFTNTAIEWQWGTWPVIDPIYPTPPYPVYPSMPIPNMPIIQPWTTTTISSITSVHTFKATVVGDSIELRLDVPGVAPSDVLVDIENGFVKVSATRSDTKFNNTQSHYVGLDYDARTCEATVEYGVLTVTIKKHKEKLACRIPVKVK